MLPAFNKYHEIHLFQKRTGPIHLPIDHRTIENATVLREVNTFLNDTAKFPHSRNNQIVNYKSANKAIIQYTIQYTTLKSDSVLFGKRWLRLFLLITLTFESMAHLLDRLTFKKGKNVET